MLQWCLRQHRLMRVSVMLVARTTINVDRDALRRAGEALGTTGASATVNAALREAARRRALADFDVRRDIDGSPRGGRSGAVAPRTPQMTADTPAPLSAPTLVDTAVWTWGRGPSPARPCDLVQPRSGERTNPRLRLGDRRAHTLGTQLGVPTTSSRGTTLSVSRRRGLRSALGACRDVVRSAMVARLRIRGFAGAMILPWTNAPPSGRATLCVSRCRVSRWGCPRGAGGGA